MLYVLRDKLKTVLDRLRTSQLVKWIARRLGIKAAKVSFTAGDSRPGQLHSTLAHESARHSPKL